MLHVGYLTDEVEVVIDDRVGDGGLEGCVNSSAQVMWVNKAEWKSGMRDVGGVFWVLSPGVSITYMCLGKIVGVG